MDISKILETLKEYPGYMALLVVIYMLIRVILTQVTSSKDFAKIAQGDGERQARLTALLEMVINKLDRARK